ncbi:Protein EFR3 [Exophiala dermatitidis]
MSSLLHPIHSASQKCRPKHQVLVLKCYPKYQKTVQEVKPNSSELSYLLYYASTRRHKLQKVGAFLEKKNASDVWKGKLGNVQVTLQILSAIIEKAPRDLSLYSRSVLTILDSILRSKDVNMVEDTIPTFEAYCRHVDAASFNADQQRAQQYLSIVQLYAGYAAKSNLVDTKAGNSIPLSIRWRTIGLRAIRAVVASEALATESARQLNTVMPVILENMSLEEENILATLQQRATTSDRLDDELARRRRTSLTTVATVDTADGDPATAVETTAGADKVAEEEVRALALRCLKQIFSAGIGSTRGQTRLATALTLKFIASKSSASLTTENDGEGTWATSLFEAIARWTPVQDRFIIVVTAMETLVRSPITEGLLEKQLVLASMIDWLLSSNVNLIGLSVMDVLLGLIHHMLLLLQLGSANTHVITPQRPDTIGLFREAKEAFDPSTVLADTETSRTSSKAELIASPTRQRLLVKLQDCVASLSNHIYYTDQISDMLTAILARLKPSPQSDVPTSAAAINDPAAAARAIAESGSIHEDPNASAFFSFHTARLTAMQVIKQILIRANNRRNSTSGAIEARARVGVQVWEGTQWLLKDEEKDVRMAYVDALVTWLHLETNKSDTLLPRDGSRQPSHSKKDTTQPPAEVNLAKRAISGASRKEPKPARSSFLALLHLAVYDSILDDVEDEANLLLLYLLLTKLVERLGVNAIRSGLPMVLTLQETVLNGEDISAAGRVNVATLVHGYLWTIAEKFDIETSSVGHEINAEISRRKRYGVWFDKVKFPALPVAEIRQMPQVANEKSADYVEEAVETIKPFLSVSPLVEEIATSYDNSLLTPPASPPSSPGRVFSVPTLGFGYGYGTAPAQKPSREARLPQKIKDEMKSSWSREACIAAAEKESAASMTGSRTGASSLPRNHLNVNGARRQGSASGQESPVDANGSTTPVFGLVSGLGSGLGSLTRAKRPSASGSPAREPEPTTSSRDSTMRVSDLKRVLSSYAAGNTRQQSPLRKAIAGSRRSTRSSATSSMVSWDEADDRNPSVLDVRSMGASTTDAAGRGRDIDRPQTSNSDNFGTTEGRTAAAAAANSENGTPNNSTGTGTTFYHQVTAGGNGDIPPVPKIPSTLILPGTWPRETRQTEQSSQEKIESTTTTAAPARVDNNGTSPPRSRKTSRSRSRGQSRDNNEREKEKEKDSEKDRGKRSSRRNSRPTSRRSVGMVSLASSAPGGGGGEKFDLDSLLAGIAVPSSRTAAVNNVKDGETTTSKAGRGSRLIRPPY